MARTVKVKVLEGWAVSDGTSQRGGGELVETDPHTAAAWLAAALGRAGQDAPRTRSTTP